MNYNQTEKNSLLSVFQLRKVVVLTGLATTMITAAALRADETEVRRPQWLDAIRLSGAADARPLVLAQVDRLNPPLTLDELNSVLDQYKKILPKGENHKSFTDPVGDRAFVLFRPRAGLTSKALEGDQVVGIVYAHSPGEVVRPRPLWSGRLVHSRPMDQTYLVVARSMSFYLTLAIFPVQPEHAIGKWPLEFPLAKLDSWPKPLEAITEKVIKLDHECAIHEIIAVPDKKTLLISAQPLHKDCAPYYFRYDFEQKTWSDVKIAARSPDKKEK